MTEKLGGRIGWEGKGRSGQGQDRAGQGREGWGYDIDTIGNMFMREREKRLWNCSPQEKVISGNRLKTSVAVPV